jgi:hypothetical protein
LPCHPASRALPLSTVLCRWTIFNLRSVSGRPRYVIGKPTSSQQRSLEFHPDLAQNN